jgi:hypothetical protein
VHALYALTGLNAGTARKRMVDQREEMIIVLLIPLLDRRNKRRKKARGGRWCGRTRKDPTTDL